jgi:hypothetical protein
VSGDAQTATLRFDISGLPISIAETSTHAEGDSVSTAVCYFLWLAAAGRTWEMVLDSQRIYDDWIASLGPWCR